MRDGGVAQPYREANLVDRNAKEAEIEKRPEVFEGSPSLLERARGFGKNGQTTADGKEQDEEDGSEDYAEGGKREWRPVAKGNFADDKIDGPDGHQHKNREVNGGTTGRSAVRRVYAHEDAERVPQEVLKVLRTIVKRDL